MYYTMYIELCNGEWWASGTQLLGGQQLRDKTMAPSVKLTYFDIYGRGELTRLMLKQESLILRIAGSRSMNGLQRNQQLPLGAFRC